MREYIMKYTLNDGTEDIVSVFAVNALMAYEEFNVLATDGEWDVASCVIEEIVA